MTIPNRLLPADVAPLIPVSVSAFRPIDVAETTSGYATSTARYEYDRATIRFPVYLNSGSTKYQQMRRFLTQVRDDGGTWWWREPISRQHYDLFCGVGDGSRYSFTLPVYSATSITMFNAGAIYAAAYTLLVANRLTANQASIETDTTGLTAYGTCVLYRVSYHALDGLYSCEVNPTGTVANIGIRCDNNVSATPSSVYAGSAWVRGAGSFTAALEWLNSGKSLLSTTTGTATAGSESAWTELTVSGTAPASTAYVRLLVNRSTSSAENYYVDCMTVANGNRADYWHPTYAPLRYALDPSVPADGNVVTCNATGYRLYKLRITNVVDWTLDVAGHVRGTLEGVEMWPS